VQRADFGGELGGDERETQIHQDHDLREQLRQGIKHAAWGPRQKAITITVNVD